MNCEKVPSIIELDSFDGDYFKYEDAVYLVYKQTFENHQFFLMVNL